MPEKKQKLVKVDNLGVIAFPNHMSDDDIIKAIRSYDVPAAEKGKTHDTSAHATGIATEKSEKQRQTVPAKPLSSSVPSLPEWANTPSSELGKRAGEHISQALGLPEIPGYEPGGWQEKIAEEFRKQHPVAGGIAHGVSEFAQGMTTPLSAALLIAAPQSKLMSAFFTLQALRGSYKDAQAAADAYKKGNNEEATKYVTESLLGAAVAGAAGAHAAEGVLPKPRPRGEVLPPAPETSRQPGPQVAAPQPQTIEAKMDHAGPSTFQTIEAPGQIVHRMPQADPREISRATDNLAQIEAKLNTMPPPLEPIDNRTPQALEEWKQRHGDWLKKAEPYLRQYQAAARQLNAVKDRGIGHVRQLPDGTKIVYLNAAGLQSLSAGIHQNLPDDASMLGAVLSPQNREKVEQNILLRGGRHLDELQELFDKGKNKNGQVVISAAPQEGETLSDALARLREELGHNVQNALSDSLGNHIKPQRYSELNATMPQAMQDHLYENYYADDDGSERANRLRVREATAKLMSRAPVEFGVTEDEAAAYLFNYFNAITEVHGADALKELLHVTNFARRLKEDYANAYKPAGSATAGQAGRGTVPGVPAAGSPGNQGGPAPPQPGISPAATSVPASLAALRAEAIAHAPESTAVPQDWLRAGTEQFAAQEGRTVGLPRYLSADERAMEIADAYQALQHNPNDPAVQAAYAALKADIDKQWDYATQVMGIHFEPWTKPGQPYQNSAEMMADVNNNKHLYFFQGGEMANDHPMKQLSGELSYNDKLRAVHDLFGHAVGQFQFGPRGEENAWAAHSQMFSPEAVPALTSETKGQNSWVNFGPHMRDAQGNLLQQGAPGWMHPAERPYAENKAALLPERFYYRQDAPLTFVSPNKFDLDLKGAAIRLGSRTQKKMSALSDDLARELRVGAASHDAIGHWEGGAENSVVQHFPIGADNDAVAYHAYNMARLGYQYFSGAFYPDEKGPDTMYSFFVPRSFSGPEKITHYLEKNGIKNSTIEPFEDGNVVHVVGPGDTLQPNVKAVISALGVKDGQSSKGRADFVGSAESRDAAASEFLQRIEEIEHRHPEWRAVRDKFEARPDYSAVHRLIREAKEPFYEVTHGTRAPGLVEIDPEKQGTGPQRGAERERRMRDPELYVPRSYFQITGTPGEPFYQHLPQQYRARLNYENIYDLRQDPDHIWDLVPAQFMGPRKITYFEKAVKDAGYDGVYDPDRGVIEAFKNTPVEKDARDGILFNLNKKPKKWTWNDIADSLPPEEVANWDTKEKRRAITEAANVTPDDGEWDAAVKAGKSGKLWYDRSSRAFDALVESQPDMFRKSDKTKFLNFVSALSPVQPVRQNLLMAINLWDKWNKAGRPVDVVWKDPKNFKGVANKNASLFRILQGRGNTFGVDLPSRLYNAIRALQDQPMSGPKVSAFAPNLGKDVDKSTNDTWMAIFAGIDPNRINEPKNYQAVTAKVRAAARKNGINTRQAQAAVWSFIKALAELSGWGKDRWIPPQEIVKKGLLTPELINRHAADFADLLQNDPEIRKRITEIGGNLNALDKKLEKYVPERPDEGSTAHVDPRLLNAAERLESARTNAKIEAHLAAKSDAPTLFDTSFSDGISFNIRRNLDELKAEAEKRKPALARSEVGSDISEIPKNQRLSPQERKEIDDLQEKDWNKTITSAEKLRYLQLLSREMQSKFGIKPLEGEARDQWVKSQLPKQTETPAFKNWFGDWEDKSRFSSRTFDPNKPPVSQVIDPDTGRPQILYHGTHGDFSSFEIGRPTKNYGTFGSWETNRHGIFMSHDPEVAHEYIRTDRYLRPTAGAKIIPVYANIKNPLDLTPERNEVDEEFLSQIEKEGINPSWIRNGIQYDWELFDGDDGKLFVEALQRMGYDGAKFKEQSHEDPDKMATVWVAFQPNQLKSAIGNRGTFDPSSTDITMQITPRQAKETNVPVDLPTSETFKRAVENTPGAEITPDGLLIDLLRYQKPEQEAAESVRTGVFYMPLGTRVASQFKKGNTPYGGPEKYQGETLIRKPLFVKGAIGGKAPEAAIDAVMGKGTAKRLADEIFGAMQEKTGISYTNPKATTAELRAPYRRLLEAWGADPDMVDHIVANSTKGNTIRYAIQENIVAHVVRNAGYDAVVGYSQKRDGTPFISEVFDLRETTYPSRVMKSQVHPDYLRESTSSKLTSTDVATQLRAPDKATPVPQIEQLKAEALARDPRRAANPTLSSVMKDIEKRSPSVVP